MKKEALNKLASNFLIWMAFGVVYIAYYAIKNNLGPNGIFPTNEITKFLDGQFVGIQIVSAAVIFFLFSFVGHKSTKEKDKAKSAKFMDLTLSEATGMLYNFGSLCLLALILSKNIWYVAAAFTLYLVGYLLYPKDTKS